jgi:hypothetical protein
LPALTAFPGRWPEALFLAEPTLLVIQMPKDPGKKQNKRVAGMTTYGRMITQINPVAMGVSVRKMLYWNYLYDCVFQAG